MKFFGFDVDPFSFAVANGDFGDTFLFPHSLHAGSEASDREETGGRGVFC